MQQPPVPNSSVPDATMSEPELTAGEVEEVLDTPLHTEPFDPEMDVIILKITEVKEYKKNMEAKTNFTNNSVALNLKALQLAKSKYLDLDKLPEEFKDSIILSLFPEAQALLHQEK